eukprot:4126393-Prymnesium_polylepis.1
MAEVEQPKGKRQRRGTKGGRTPWARGHDHDSARRHGACRAAYRLTASRGAPTIVALWRGGRPSAL